MDTLDSGRFQLWEYSRSHRQLLIRRPGTASRPENIDLIFRGVTFVSLAAALQNPSVRKPTPDELERITQVVGTRPRERDVHVFDAEPTFSFVIAASFRRSQNSLDPFESSLDSYAYADTRARAEQLEREVLVALAHLPLELEPMSRSGKSRLDATVHLNERTIGIEVKWVNPTVAHKSIRNRMMELVPRIDEWLRDLDGLLVVVGTSDEAVLQEALAHLRTALGAHVRVDVVGFVAGDDPERLRRSVEQLAAQP